MVRPRLSSLLFSFGLFAATQGNAQLSYKVLFLGNSYTATNNLPQLIHDVALSAGDTLVFDSYTPGGYQLVDHTLDPSAQNKIMAGGWEYVVMQGQSQEPVILSGQFSAGGHALFNQVRQHNPCAVPMLYMTWGRENGDAGNCANFPAMCTYLKMDSALKHRYLLLAGAINGEVSPVSAVWRNLRQNHPSIQLYLPDGSHPTLAGSYAAACSFYAALFKKDPTLITYDASLNAGDAAIIRAAAKTEVFGSLQVWDFKKPPVALFNCQVGPGVNELQFQAFDMGVQQSYYWDFGDGGNSTLPNPTHSYASNGTYTVTLTTTNCDLQGTHTAVADTVVQFCAHTPSVFTNKGWLCHHDTLWTQPADSYQWLLSGSPIPETKQYIVNPAKYNTTGFSVIATTGGCSEQSTRYTDTPEWSGYYFDGIGDPCEGDTVQFAVLHVNGSLSGNETIHWYKNGVLLQSVTNEDTLEITSGGKYECRVVNPFAHCPFDTASWKLEYDCGGVTGVGSNSDNHAWRIFPNPASGYLVISNPGIKAPVRADIFNVFGQLVKSIQITLPATTIDIAALPAGVYIVCVGGNSPRNLRFLRE